MVFKSLLHLWKVVKQNGGLWQSVRATFVRDDLKDGVLVGEDNYGNKYYENNKYFLGRNRWVNYADHVYLDYDGSQVAPEWSGWLHYRTDLLPHEDPSRPHYPWMSPHTENMTGTSECYVPWSTTRSKILAWKPPRGFGAGTGSGDCCSSFGQPKPPQEPECEEKPKPCDVLDKKKKDKPACEKPVTAFH